MNKISAKEFEEKVRDLIERKITRTELANQLGISMRTLNDKITKLSDTNPDLYMEFIEIYPYKPKTIEVDIEDLALQVIKTGMSITSKETGISSRTITRKVNTLKKTNPELYDLYKRRNDKMSDDEKAIYYLKLDRLDKMNKPKRTELNDKEADLTSTLSEFERRVAGGMSKNKAAISLGFDGYPTIWKKYQELKRITTQNRSLESGKRKNNKSFREELQSKYRTGKLCVQNQGHNEDISKEVNQRIDSDEIPL